ncbi:MAG: lipoate--protein ligase family protein [Gemmataceae bacterium]
MNRLDLTLPTPAENLALDEALLLDAEAGGGEVLRFWELPALAAVLGSGGVVADDVLVAACAADGVPVVRRSSGGGTVLLGPGCLCFSLVLRYDRHPALGEINASYRLILDTILDALRVPGAALEGICDLAVAGRKFSGNAQQRKRDHLLHHGTLLYGFDLGLVSRYLTLPPRRPEYRAGRDHGDFVTNAPLTRAELVARLAGGWEASDAFAGWPAAAVARLVGEKYGRDSWSRRR